MQHLEKGDWKVAKKKGKKDKKEDKAQKRQAVKWKYKEESQAILIDNRAPEGFAETVRASYEPQEFRELLKKGGSKETVAKVTTSRLFNR